MKQTLNLILFLMILTSTLCACESGLDPALDGDLPSSDGDEHTDGDLQAEGDADTVIDGDLISVDGDSETPEEPPVDPGCADHPPCYYNEHCSPSCICHPTFFTCQECNCDTDSE